MISFGLGGVRGPASQEEKAQSALADWGEVIGQRQFPGVKGMTLRQLLHRHLTAAEWACWAVSF